MKLQHLAQHPDTAPTCHCPVRWEDTAAGEQQRDWEAKTRPEDLLLFPELNTKGETTTIAMGLLSGQTIPKRGQRVNKKAQS